MSVNAQDILVRLKRLHQFADLFQKELGEVTELVKAEFGLAVDPLSTSPAEMQQMLDQLEKKVGGTPKSRGSILGQKLQQYLHSSVIDGGLGLIQPNDEFKQYQECISSTPIGQVAKWPAGFYVNGVTSETQLLLTNQDDTFMFDRLPGLEVTLCYMTDGVFPKRIEDMEVVEFNSLIQLLDQVLTAYSENFIPR